MIGSDKAYCSQNFNKIGSRLYDLQNIHVDGYGILLKNIVYSHLYYIMSVTAASYCNKILACHSIRHLNIYVSCPE